MSIMLEPYSCRGAEALRRGGAAVPLPRGPLSRRQGVGKLAQLYAPDVEYWMPAWDDDDQLVTDPQKEVSLIWYGHKGGLEDRVFRIKTERSSATSMPEPRTSHNISNVEILTQGGGVCELRCNWVTFSYRYKTVEPISAPPSTRSIPRLRSR